MIKQPTVVLEGHTYQLPRGIVWHVRQKAFIIHFCRGGKKNTTHFFPSTHGSVAAAYQAAVDKLADLKATLPANIVNKLKRRGAKPFREDIPGIRVTTSADGAPIYSVQIGAGQKSLRTRRKDIGSTFMDLHAFACISTARHLYLLCNEERALFDWSVFSIWRERLVHAGMFMIADHGNGRTLMLRPDFDLPLYSRHSVAGDHHDSEERSEHSQQEDCEA